MEKPDELFPGMDSIEKKGLLRKRSAARASMWGALALALVPIFCLVVPMYVIRPFRPQDPSQLAAALTVRNLGPWISAIAAIAVIVLAIRVWRRSSSLWIRATAATLTLVTVAGACLTNVNIFEIMFHPYTSPAFGSVESAQVEADDKVLSVTIDGQSHAYPIRAMGYHHIVNDTIGNTYIAVTYCTLCHTGLVWNRLFQGRVLHFRLAGINNGNALMRDEETSSIWQQSTGQAIFGPLKGQQLGLIHSDELTFALWRGEQPHGLVLKPDAPYAAKYEDKDWEKHVEKTRTVVNTRNSGIEPHELMLGVIAGGQEKAYPVKTILAAKLIQDRISATPILIMVGQDRASIRVFEASNSSMAFIPASENTPAGGIVRDVTTGSLWNFEGCAIDGQLKNQCLKPMDANKDYWFDWMNHHPKTLVFRS